MTSSSASTHKPANYFLNPYGTTAAPPPTPSAQPSNQQTSTSDATVDALTRLLHRLPPNLSLPSRLSPRTTTSISTSVPTVSLLQPKPELLSAIQSASTQLGFFQLTHHPITQQLAESSESDAITLFNLPSDQKRLLFPKNWPLGYDGDDQEEEDDGHGCMPKESFCLDNQCCTDQSESATELEISSLREFTRGLEKLGLEVVEQLFSSMGLKGVDPSKLNSLMWVSEGSVEEDDKLGVKGRLYPFIVGLQYQIRRQKYSLMSNKGSIVVEPEVDSVLVTLGDIAQVWSNGKTKRVRGRAIPVSMDNKNMTTSCMSMSLLVTLPLAKSMVEPLLPEAVFDDGKEMDVEEGSRASTGKSKLEEDEENLDGGNRKRVFNSFSFEDYAWRIYHERLLFKDPLDMYCID